MNALILEQFPQKLQRRLFVAALLNKDIEHLAFIIDRAPEIHPPATDFHHHLVQVPAARRRRPTSAQIRRDQRAELVRPAPHSFATDFNAALGQQLLDVSNAQREPEIKPNCVPDHIRRKPVTLK
jgi:hypothetical protein